ncbi:MAG: MATE family efflux transporter [Lachnospiraceae bacterium]|nr:MATE family efflux transporter [Lachnospiraceae bacterium]
MAFGQLMGALVSASDAVMLGSLSQDAMSAVSLAGNVYFVFTLFLFTLTIGENVFAAQYWGKRDVSSMEQVLALVLKPACILSVLFTLATACVPEVIMGLFTADAALIEYGALYLRTVSLSYLLNGISPVYSCMMRNTGQTLQATVIGSVCVLLNIGLNAVLIYGFFGLPRMGIQGAALATVMTKVVEFIWIIAVLKRNGVVKTRWKYLISGNKELWKTFWKYTLPILGNEIVWGVGFTMGSVIIGHLGADAVAANAVVNVTKNLLICFCMGVGSGGSILVGNELGAGNLERAKECGALVTGLSVISGAVTGLVLLIISPLILQFANLTPVAKGYLKWMLVICSYYIIGKSVNSTTIGGIFCAGGDSGFGFVCDAVVMWGIIVPLGALAAFVWELPVLAVYFIINLDEMLKLPAVWKHYRKYKWVKDLTMKEENHESY